jgi:hypothetical protein
MSGGAKRRHSSFGFYVLSKTYIAIGVFWIRFFESPPLAGFQKIDFGH